MESFDVIICGGGPAGLAAGLAAASHGAATLILERDCVIGRKLCATGNGRCNFSNTLHPLKFMEEFGRNGRFMIDALRVAPREFFLDLLLREGIRVFRINPKGTSMYAYDGSGQVVRDANNYSLCTFASGKRYNADLSASYNIGARYFLRALHKSIPATEWSELEAKVPGLSKRTTWTLDTLRRVCAARTPEAAIPAA